MKDIFISYKSEDIGQAVRVRDHLESEGLSVWMAPDSITGGASYAAEIPPAIDNAGVFVLILSGKTQTSKWVPRELDQAINAGKKVMPFMIENCELESEFRFYLTNVQRYPAYESFEKSLVRMTEDIKKYLAPKQEEKPKTPEAAKRPKPKKTKRPKEKKGKKWLAIPAVILAAVLIFALIGSLNKVEIAGETFEKDATSLVLYKKEVTADDVNTIMQLRELKRLGFEECTIKPAYIGGLAGGMISDLSFKNCNLTNEQIASLDLTECSLNVLDLSGSELDSLDIIKGQEDCLHDLRINDTNVGDISVLKGFSKLSNFEAENCRISDISPLAECAKLSTLKLSGNKLTSLAPLENLTEICRLYVSDNKLTSLSGIEKCINMTTLAADNNQLKDINGLKNATRLTAVSLKNNSIRYISILEKSSETIEHVYLADNLIEDISPLSNCSHIDYLDISGNNIGDISCLAKISELVSLDASRNKIRGEVSLKGLPELKYIALSGNGITELDAEFKNEKGSVLALDGNKLEKITTGYVQAYRMLILGENDMTDFEDIYNSSGNIMLKYSEKLDLDKLKAAGYNRITLIGVPLDKQLDVKDKLGAGTVEFCDKTEYDINEIMPDFSHGM